MQPGVTTSPTEYKTQIAFLKLQLAHTAILYFSFLIFTPIFPVGMSKSLYVAAVMFKSQSLYYR